MLYPLLSIHGHGINMHRVLEAGTFDGCSSPFAQLIGRVSVDLPFGYAILILLDELIRYLLSLQLDAIACRSKGAFGSVATVVRGSLSWRLFVENNIPHPVNVNGEPTTME